MIMRCWVVGVVIANVYIDAERDKVKSGCWNDAWTKKTPREYYS